MIVTNFEENVFILRMMTILVSFYKLHVEMFVFTGNEIMQCIIRISALENFLNQEQIVCLCVQPALRDG